MKELARLKLRLDALRPLRDDQLERLWPLWRQQDALFVYASNAIEGNTLTLGETTVILQDGVTIGGKRIREHLEVINGGKAYLLMLDLARARTPITENVLLDLHAIVVSEEAYAGTYRREAVYIRSAQHVPSDRRRAPDRMAECFERYERDRSHLHPILVGARLHFDLLTIHPFVDGNGRTARLANNLHLLAHGYPPVLIDPQEDRPRYFDVLRSAQMRGEPGRGDPTEFEDFMAELQQRSLRTYLAALERAYEE